jgi:hypothetical protein
VLSKRFELRLHLVDALRKQLPAVSDLLNFDLQIRNFVFLLDHLIRGLGLDNLAETVLLVEVHDELVLSLDHSAVFLQHASRIAKLVAELRSGCLLDLGQQSQVLV